jgi:hypothetical protein
VAETVTTAGGYITIDMRATCVRTAGFTNPCTVGQQVFAFPPHTYLQSARASAQTHSMIMAFPALKTGLWKFEVLPGGNNSAALQYRTFRIETFSGG